MKKIILAAVAAFLCSMGAKAVMACPDPQIAHQPDGTTLTLIGHGDEFYGWGTTVDGYVLTEAADGSLVYAMGQNEDGTLVASAMLAHDVSARSGAEKAFLSQYALLSADLQTIGQAKAQQRRTAATEGPKRMAPSKNFRGLIILVNYTNRKFQRSDAQAFYQAMANQENYTGFYPEGDNTNFEKCTGSVRDYFRDNSAGKFNPPFDVVGPVEINFNDTYAQQTSRAQTLIQAALKAADPYVDYSQYDADGDGEVDMFFCIFAGYGSNYGGTGNYIWPHKSYVYGYSAPKCDGKSFGVYACSVEINGSASSGAVKLDGIGTICHEFSHVLGLPDEYDTDYANSGGEANDPGKWSVMSGGSYNNSGRTPVGYSLFQRMQGEFTDPAEIDETGHYELTPLDKSNAGLTLATPSQYETFLLEYRQKNQKWEKYLPGNGLLVYRLDYSNSSVWSRNKVNCNPDHMYYELLRAHPGSGDSGGDPFPGSGKVTVLNNFTSPSLRTWTKQPNAYGIENITLINGERLTFDVVVSPEQSIEDFEGSIVSAAGVFDGNICKWTLANGAQIETPNCNNGIEDAALALPVGATFTSVPQTKNVGTVTFNAYNPGKASVLLADYSLDNGQTWARMPDAKGKPMAVTLAGESGGYYTFDMSKVEGQDNVNALIRFSNYKGTKDNPIYVDNIAMTFYEKDPSGIEDAQVIATDRHEVARYNMAGQLVSTNTPGVAIVRYSDGTSAKVLVK